MLRPRRCLLYTSPFGDEPLDKEIADFIEEQRNGIESFEDVEKDLLDAIGKGFAVSEILRCV